MNLEEQCVDCVVQGCQFSDFLKGKKYYAKNEKDDCYCLFHAPKELKEKFTYVQNELFAKTIDAYIDAMIQRGRKIDFSNAVFHKPLTISDKNATLLDFHFETLDEYRIESNIEMDFTNVVFYEYVDIRNIKCNKLTFKDTKFHKGGALKNRKGTNRLFIEELHFRPVVLESDFVIDIGAYANQDGNIEVDTYGTIKNIEFENHKEGKGIVYFVGLNSGTEKADFRNRIIDNVSFQNCDLSKCYFLNAKVDKTEFRNCIFPQGYVYENYNVLQGFFRKNFSPIILVIVMLISVIILGIDFFNIFSIDINKFLKKHLDDLLDYWGISFFFILISGLLLCYLFASFYTWFESQIARLDFKNIHILEYFKSFGRHISIADEVDLYRHIYKKTIKKNEAKKTFTALAATYIQLKNNFLKYDYQMAGSFFYVQRYFEVLSSRNKSKIERFILVIHHFINGFGERFMKPVMWFILTGFLFAVPAYIGIGYIPIVKKEGIFATEATPKFLLESNTSRLVEYKIQYLKKEEVNRTKWVLSKTFLKDGNSSKDDNVTKQTYFAPKLKEDFSTALVYSFSRFVSPLTSQTKSWFKTEGRLYMSLSFLETTLLYLFFGAFILAVKNRIKR